MKASQPAQQQLDFLNEPGFFDPRREEIIAALLKKERWRVDETAYYLRCSFSHVHNLIADGTLTGTNIARLPTSRPLYRIYRDSVLTFERQNTEGAR